MKQKYLDLFLVTQTPTHYSTSSQKYISFKTEKSLIHKKKMYKTVWVL